VIDIAGNRVRLRSLTLDDVEPLAAAIEADATSFGPGGEEARRSRTASSSMSPSKATGG